MPAGVRLRAIQGGGWETDTVPGAPKGIGTAFVQWQVGGSGVCGMLVGDRPRPAARAQPEPVSLTHRG